MEARRLLIVSNRLPVSVHVAADRARLVPASGGLATGLRTWHERSAGLWIGWPGDLSRFTAAQRADLDRQMTERRIVPVALSADQVERYYDGFCNRVLWPAFHYLIDRVPADAAGWDAYRAVNEAFADAVVREHRSGDVVWVHDYHLMLVPALLRERLPEARVGFFLHVPFPSSEVFRTLPRRREILDGVLGADLVGFHTFAYMRHFVASLLHVEGVESDIDRVRLGGREVRLGVFPMGVDAARFAALAEDPDVLAEVDAIRKDAGGRQIVLGIDRLDYTKGIPRRLEAVERLLTANPGLRDRMRYMQVAVPSRGSVDSYQRFRRQVEERVGRINGACATLRSTPVHYLHRSVSTRQLVALYRAADVMLVTPLRDGMNLVSKEFAASRVDEDGVLVLSEFAGAAAELEGALVVNPYDVDAVAGSIMRALEMPLDERRARMRGLRRSVLAHDVDAWAEDFLSALDAERPLAERPEITRPEPSFASALAAARRAGPLHLLLEYDAALVAPARTPEHVAPDADLLALLGSLAAAPGIRVDIVSARPREILLEWFGELPVSLWAENGFWRRSHPDAVWEPAATVSADPLNRVKTLLEQITASTPGSQVEIQSASLAWHYRGTPREFGARQAHELRMLLGDALSNQPLEVLEGNKMIEVRLRGVSKAMLAQRVSEESSTHTLVLVTGDDHSGEEMCRALPPTALTASVGRRAAGARFTLADYRDARRVLRSLAERGPDVVDAGAFPTTLIPPGRSLH